MAEKEVGEYSRDKQNMGSYSKILSHIYTLVT
jgi:hypothetical protein